MTLQPLINLH